MRFLCLPGAFCNSKTMEAQLDPFISRLNEYCSTSVVYTEGRHPIDVPAEFTGFFGPPPNFTFVKLDSAKTLSAVRTFTPNDDDPEKALRAFQDSCGWGPGVGLGAALNRLNALMDDDGTIDGVIGYSEGAGIAAALLLEEQRRATNADRSSRFKCAIFIAGVPPTDPATGRFVLQDEAGQPINMPTCHVVGTQDKMLAASMALYNLCDPDTADLFDHGGGHAIPRDQRTLGDLAEAVQKMILLGVQRASGPVG